MNHRAHSILQVKHVNEDERKIVGIASTPEVDRQGDIVESEGIRCAESVVLLMHHDHAKPVGRAKFLKPTRAGIGFTATLPRIAEAGVLKDRVDECWGLVKSKILTGVSIGFKPREGKVERMASGGLRFLEIEIYELSIVSVPANASATIQEVRSLDARYLSTARTTSAVATTKRTAFPVIDTYPFEPVMFDAICKAVAITHNRVAELLDREDARKANDEMASKAQDVMYSLIDVLTQTHAMRKSAGGMTAADLSAFLQPVFRSLGESIKASTERREGEVMDLLAGLDARLTAIERGGRR